MIIDNFYGKDIQKAFHLTAFFSAISTTLPAGYTFKGESHRFWELVYVARGRIQATENTDIYPMTEGDLIIHAPTEFHTINNPHDTAADIRICSFYAVGDLPPNLTGGVFHLSAKKRAELEQLLAQQYRYFHATDAAPLEGQYCAERVSAFLIELADATAEAHPDDSRSAAEYRRVIEAMNAHIYDNITLADFAEELCISVSYIKQLFERFGGISPKAYYAQLRCNEAVHLLHSGLSVTQTAERLNFSSPNYFSVFFRRQMGVLPSRYGKTGPHNEGL